MERSSKLCNVTKLLSWRVRIWIQAALLQNLLTWDPLKPWVHAYAPPSNIVVTALIIPDSRKGMPQRTIPAASLQLESTVLHVHWQCTTNSGLRWVLLEVGGIGGAYWQMEALGSQIWGQAPNQETTNVLPHMRPASIANGHLPLPLPHPTQVLIWGPANCPNCPSSSCQANLYDDFDLLFISIL